MINKSAKSLFQCIHSKQLCFFASKPRSYYELLDVNPTCTQKELRSNFLKKGNQCD